MGESTFDADLTTGSGTMDGEHRLQVSLIQALRDAVGDGRPTAEVDEILDQLLEFTKVHFSSEEMLMRLYSFDGYDAHALEHKSAIERIEGVREQYRAGNTTMSLETVDTLGRWIVAHTRRADRALGDFLAALGPRAS